MFLSLSLSKPVNEDESRRRRRQRILYYAPFAFVLALDEQVCDIAVATRSSCVSDNDIYAIHCLCVDSIYCIIGGHRPASGKRRATSDHRPKRTSMSRARALFNRVTKRRTQSTRACGGATTTTTLPPSFVIFASIAGELCRRER